MQIKVFPFNAFSENTYVLHDETKEAVIIDPGCYTHEERQELQAYIDGEQLKVVALLNTHAHVDHVLGNAFVKNTFKVKLHLHPADNPTLAAVENYASMWGFPAYEPTTADEELKEGATFTFGNSALKVLFVPGHAPGHVAFYHAESGNIIAGDVLFRRSIGRTDLPGGDFDILAKSIKEVMYTLPEETVIHPGHGPATSVGEEKRENPYVR
ncbi:MBL fold metallo-hydrolase [Persicobacter diffluens]|uniref:MBL fold hydrolase n=1 Tax=Persicobacter diffluens TaxID=981 RepID=A0AAN4W0B6_9BACT|nr:MBL fold hydrolase [Persicobacter diffluens]